MAGLLGLALTWNLLLRRLVKQRSSQLATEMRARDRVEIEFDATLRERTRLAADLHDTLEQALTGLAFQLDTSKVLASRAPETSGRHLELGRQLLTRSREDLRRSIWNLRARALDDNSFADAIRSAAEQAAEGRPITISVEEEGEPHPLPEFIAGNLLLLAQEAMTNAIKHGQAETVTVRVGYAPGWISLEVRDDGMGFNLKSAPGLQEGHFGLQGMRERANRMDGLVRIESLPGEGATISVRVPIPEKTGIPITAVSNS
jgi:signal transduction histidine kinase